LDFFAISILYPRPTGLGGTLAEWLGFAQGSAGRMPRRDVPSRLAIKESKALHEEARRKACWRKVLSRA